MEDVVTIKKSAVISAHKLASPETRKTLEVLMPDVLGDILKRVTTLEDVCREAGVDMSYVTIPANADRRKRNSIRRDICDLICEVFNEGVELDYSNSSQSKHYPYGRFVPGSGFSLDDVGYDRTNTSVGARLSTRNEEHTRHICKIFFEDFRVIMKK